MLRLPLSQTQLCLPLLPPTPPGSKYHRPLVYNIKKINPAKAALAVLEES